jgi:outer membrane protein TolC
VQWQHAKDQVEVARMSAEDVRRQLALSTGRTYLGIIAQHHVVEVSQRARDSARAHYQFAHQRFSGGYGTRLDEVRAAQEVAADEAQLQASVANLARLRETLGVLVGADHAIDVTDDVTLPGAPSLEDSLKDSLSLRSDVQLFRGRLHAADRVRRDDWADYTPSLLLTAEPFVQYPPTAQLPQYGFQGQLLLSWTIYDGGCATGWRRSARRWFARRKRGSRATCGRRSRRCAPPTRRCGDRRRRSRRPATRRSWPPRGCR